MGDLRVLLGSGGIRGKERLDTYHEEVGRCFEECETVLFVPFAGANHDRKTERMAQFTSPAGVELIGIHTFENPVEAVESADGVYVGGGNTFLLTRDLHRLDLIEPIRSLALGGTPYMGVSAGANVAGPTMQTTNDMPIVEPISFSTFDIVPFQINPHYFSGSTFRLTDGDIKEHYGETREDRLNEFHEQNGTPVLGLWEGAYLRWDGHTGLLTGNDATIHKPDDDPLVVCPGTKLTGDLKPIE